MAMGLKDQKTLPRSAQKKKLFISRADSTNAYLFPQTKQRENEERLLMFANFWVNLKGRKKNQEKKGGHCICQIFFFFALIKEILQPITKKYKRPLPFHLASHLIVYQASLGCFFSTIVLLFVLLIAICVLCISTNLVTRKILTHLFISR